MFIAMNRFKIVLGKEKEFEDVWKNRDTHLEGVPGFKEFHLVKGDTNDEHTLYASRPVNSCGLGFVFCVKCGHRAGRVGADDI